MVLITRSDSFSSQREMELNEARGRLLKDEDEESEAPQASHTIYQDEEWKEYCSPTSWSKRFVALGGVAGLVVLRVANSYLWTNALACYSVGVTALYAISCAAPPEISARIRQMALPVLGQTSIFAFSQAWINDPAQRDRTVFDDLIIGFLGANLYMSLKWAWEQRGIRSETYMPAGVPQSKDRLQDSSWLNPTCIHFTKFLASIGFGVGAFAVDDPISKGILSFFSSFFISQVAGERLIEKIDTHIEEKETAGGKTCFRSFKTVLLTVAHIAQVASFTPWYTPTSAQRLAQLVYVGISLGFFAGINDQSEDRKIRNIPIEHLQELEKLPVPQRGPDGKCNCKWLAHRVWKFCVPIFSIAAMLGFCLWQDISVLDKKYAKIILGATLGGFVAGTGFCYSVDEAWDPTKRRAWLDFFMTKIWFSPRILGVDPLFLYFVITNSLKMDSDAIDEDTNPYHLALIFLGWFIYGSKTGHELFIGASDRIGNPQRKYPKMAVINAVSTLILYLYRKN